MARVNNLTNFLNDVATAIKQKLGDNTPIPASQFDTKIGEIETGGNYQTKSISITTNGNYTQLPDTGFDAMDQVVISVNVPSGSGDVKLFTTEEAMQADPNPNEGDLAVVYREELTGVTEESEFSSCTFPNEVVLDEAFSGNINGSFRAVDQSVMFDGMVDMSSSRFRFNGWGESSQVRITYTSNDGITYTRTDGGEELQEFGTTIKWEGRGDPFNSVIGNFMKIGGSYFDGLYQCSKVRDIYAVNSLDLSENITKIYIPSELLDYVSDDLPDFKDRYTDANEILIVSDLVQNNNIIRGTAYLGYGVMPAIISNHLYIAKSYHSSYSSTDVAFQKIEFDTSASNIILSNTLITYSTLSQNTRLGTNLTGGTGHTYYSCIPNDPILTDVTIANYGQLVYNTNMDRPLYYIKCDSIGLDGSHTQAQENIIYDKLTYVFAPTQLDTTADYVYEKTFYGKNGVESGTLTTNVSNSFADVNAEVYAKIQEQYDNMQPRILTDQDKDIDSDIRTIPVKSDGTPLLDTSNVTNMVYMFRNCSNLTSIPLLDTSNVTTMGSMFYNCKNLITIPLLDTSNVTTMLYMFSGCSSLTTILLLDTSNVTNMGSMFYNCKNLITIPLLDTSSVTNMYYMFSSCSSLNNESLNNILAMCVNAVKITSNKTLKYIGLSQEQANICKTLSNYQDFVNAGWTTGY